MSVRTPIALTLACFLLHCGSADEGDTSRPGAAGAGDRPATDGTGSTGASAAASGDGDGDGGGASSGPAPFSRKDACDPPVEVNGPQSSASTRKTVRRLALATTPTSLASFVWDSSPTSSGAGTSQIARLDGSTWLITDLVATGRRLAATSGRDLLTAVVSSTLSVSRDGAPFYTGNTVSLASAGINAALQMGPAGHGVFSWHDGAAIHVARVAPGARVATELPAIVGANPSNNDYIGLTVDGNGDGFVFFRKQDGQLAVRGWRGAGWAGAAATIPGTSYGIHMSEPVALPDGNAFAAVRTLQARAVRVGIENATTKVTADDLASTGSVEDMAVFASAEGELTIVGARGYGTTEAREVYAARRPVAGSWSEVKLAPSIAANLLPAAAIDARGDVTVAYRTATGVEHRRIAKGATSWEPAVRIAPSLAISDALGVQVTIDPANGDPVVGVGAPSAAGTTTMFVVRCH